MINQNNCHFVYIGEHLVLALIPNLICYNRPIVIAYDINTNEFYMPFKEIHRIADKLLTNSDKLNIYKEKLSKFNVLKLKQIQTKGIFCKFLRNEALQSDDIISRAHDVFSGDSSDSIFYRVSDAVDALIEDTVTAGVSLDRYSFKIDVNMAMVSLYNAVLPTITSKISNLTDDFWEMKEKVFKIDDMFYEHDELVDKLISVAILQMEPSTAKEIQAYIDEKEIMAKSIHDSITRYIDAKMYIHGIMDRCGSIIPNSKYSDYIVKVEWINTVSTYYANSIIPKWHKDGIIDVHIIQGFIETSFIITKRDNCLKLENQGDAK